MTVESVKGYDRQAGRYPDPQGPLLVANLFMILSLEALDSYSRKMLLHVTFLSLACLKAIAQQSKLALNLS